MNKKNVKKGLLFVLCMALVSVVSIVGTMAVLTKTSNKVVNTFVATQTIADAFTLTETGASGSEGTLNKSFSGIVPGCSITDKDPTITVTEVKATAYMFVEIVEANNKVVDSGEPGTKFYTYAIDNTAGWLELADVTGKNGGKVWYQELAIDSADGSQVTTYNVLLNKTVTFADYTEGKAPADATMSIYGYLVQTSGYNSAAAAYNANWAYVAPEP